MRLSFSEARYLGWNCQRAVALLAAPGSSPPGPHGRLLHQLALGHRTQRGGSRVLRGMGRIRVEQGAVPAPQIVARPVFHRHDPAGAVLSHSVDGFAGEARRSRQSLGVDSALHRAKSAGGDSVVRGFFRFVAGRTRGSGEARRRSHRAVLLQHPAAGRQTGRGDNRGHHLPQHVERIPDGDAVHRGPGDENVAGRNDCL